MYNDSRGGNEILIPRDPRPNFKNFLRFQTIFIKMFLVFVSQDLFWVLKDFVEIFGLRLNSKNFGIEIRTEIELML